MTTMSSIPDGVLTLEQERELEKVNAFYLQKEAEVCVPNVNPYFLFAISSALFLCRITVRHG